MKLKSEVNAVLNRFVMLTPETLSEALSMLKAHEDKATYIMAGGTDLLPFMRAGTLRPEYIVDICGLGLNKITETESTVEIGAACTLKTVYSSPVICRYFPILAEAARSVGAVQTRGIATLGGNSCAAVPSLDTAPPLFIYGAEYKVISQEGARMVPVTEFFKGPKRTAVDSRRDILESILLQKPEPGFTARFTKFGRRAALSLSIVNCALGAVKTQGRLTSVRACVGACAPVPVKLVELEGYLEGKSSDEVDYSLLESLVKSAISPISDIRASAEYRSELAAALMRRQLRDVFEEGAAK